MRRKSITNFEYISFLVDRIKEKVQKKENIDWYFDELARIYGSLLRSSTFAIVKRVRSKNLSYKDIYNLVQGIFFKLVLRYSTGFINKDNEQTKGFTTVYFSNYLKKTLKWEIYRLMNPIKPDSDELEKNLHYVDINNLIRYDNQALEIDTAPSGVTKNFIGLCHYIRIKLKSDLHGDIMFLLYAYNFKFNEIARLLGLPTAKVSVIANDIKIFWTNEGKDSILKG